jgi:hypothetical protein
MSFTRQIVRNCRWYADVADSRLTTPAQTPKTRDFDFVTHIKECGPSLLSLYQEDCQSRVSERVFLLHMNLLALPPSNLSFVSLFNSIYSSSDRYFKFKVQKALFGTEIGKPVTLGTRSIREPGPGEVLIKVTASMSPFLSLRPDSS